MGVTHIAVERKRELQIRLRRSKPWNPMASSDLRFLDMLDCAIPCYWDRRAIFMNFKAADDFPHDAIMSRSDLLAPVQWSYSTCPGARRIWPQLPITPRCRKRCWFSTAHRLGCLMPQIW